MAETLHNCSVAYTKGAVEAQRNHNKGYIGNCPYGETKSALKHWWIAGFHDAKANNVDQNMIIKVSKL